MKDDKSFKITDRRVFDSEGSVKDRDAIDKEKNEIKKETKQPKSSSEKGSSRRRDLKPLAIDFATFVSSMHASAMMHFGMIPNPVDNSVSVEVDLGKQNIDILEMLEQKTTGNLSPDEASLLESALYDLRMRYVELTKKQN
jgi:hypothetical protein